MQTTTKNFIKWLNSDNVVKINNVYRTQCTQYRKEFSLEGLFVFFKKEYSN